MSSIPATSPSAPSADSLVPFFSLDQKRVLLLRGVAIISVLLVHMRYLYLFVCCVNLFLLLSGYGLCLSFEKSGVTGYWSKKLTRVYLPYLAVAVFQLLALGWESKRQLLFTPLGLDFRCILDKTMLSTPI